MFIEGKDLVKKYGKGEATVYALDHTDFSMEKGELVVILGPSGSGKSTLLNILGGLDKVTEGSMMVDGVNLEKMSAKELSGGQQQRTAIARAMVKKPDILLCDELTGALDTKSSKDVLKRVQSMNDTYKTTVVIITHNVNIASMADRIIKITDGKVVSNTKNADKKRVEEMEL